MPPVVTVRVAIDTYLARVKPRVKTGTYTSYTWFLDKFATALGDAAPVTGVTADQIEGVCAARYRAPDSTGKEPLSHRAERGLILGVVPGNHTDRMALAGDAPRRADQGAVGVDHFGPPRRVPSGTGAVAFGVGGLEVQDDGGEGGIGHLS